MREHYRSSGHCGAGPRREMIGLSWNCRGLGSPRAECALKGVIRLENPQFVFLSETKLKGKEWDSLKRRLNYSNFLSVDCEGEGRHRKGGIAMLWKNEMDMVLMSCSRNHLDFTYTAANGGQYRITGIYGYPDDDKKHMTWQLLKDLNGVCALPWLCFGDFNNIIAHEDKKGGNPKNQRDIDGFREALDHCCLRDIRFEGYRFTWSNNRAGEDNTQERLDLFFASDTWVQEFPCSKVVHLPKRKSDHVPITIHVQANIQVTGKKTKKRRGFRFEKEWLRDDECGHVVADSWQVHCFDKVRGKISLCASRIRSWSATRTKDFVGEIRRKREQITELMQQEPTIEVLDEIRGLEKDIDEIERCEETYWAQRSRQSW